MKRLLTIGLTAFCWVAESTSVAVPPNIVVIYADDLGYGDVACYNRERGKIPTPSIDRLAAEGMRFTDAHSSSGVCSPSRYTLLTGRYHWRTRLQRGIVGLWGRPLIAPNRLTIARLLKQHGYRTACFGKWHLGWEWPFAPDEKPLFMFDKEDTGPVSSDHVQAWQRTFAQHLRGGPLDCGFDVYHGTDVPNWPPFCFIEQDKTVGIPDTLLPQGLLVRLQASRQGPALDGWALKPILPTLGRRTCEYIVQAAREEQPFFIYMPLTAPHTPIAVNEPWVGKSGLNSYADFVMETDAIVGQVLNTLNSVGVAERTLVVFTSDNGFAPYVGAEALEAMGHFPSGPLRGYKSDVWEGGHRVPFVVRWPGQVAANSVSHRLVHQADLLATFAEIVGAELQPSEGEDSYSLFSVLTGTDEPPREHAVSQSSGGLIALRHGPWKLIFGPGSGGWTEGGDELPAQLYNLESDLGETNNLYADQPQRVDELTTLMHQLVENGRSTRGTPQPNDQPFDWRRHMSAP